MSFFLSHFFNLIQKTGGRWIVTDQAGRPSLVVMNWQDWEKLISNQNSSFTSLPKKGVASLTGDELLDKINCEISLLKASQAPDQLDDSKKEEKVGEEERYYLEFIQ